MKKEKKKKLKKLKRLFKTSQKVVKNRKKFAKAIFSVLFLFTNWDKSEQKILFKKK